MNRLSPDSEKNLHQVLRALPPRQAPRTLEARVFAELERRQARAWWQGSFAGWPNSARVLFFFASAAAAVVVIVGLARLAGWASPASLADAGANAVGHWQRLGGVLTQAGSAVVGTIPTYWLYGAAAVIGACYVALVGVGAAAYRAFFTRS